MRAGDSRPHQALATAVAEEIAKAGDSRPHQAQATVEAAAEMAVVEVGGEMAGGIPRRQGGGRRTLPGGVLVTLWRVSC